MGCVLEQSIIGGNNDDRTTVPVVYVTSPTNGQKSSAAFEIEGTVHDASELRGVFAYAIPVGGNGLTNLIALNVTGGELSSFVGVITLSNAGWYYIRISAQNEWNRSSESPLILVQVISPVMANTNLITNTNSSTNTNTVTDTNPPVVMIVHPTNGQKVGANYTLSGTVSDDLSRVESVKVRLDNGTFTSAFLNAGNWSADFTVSPGVHTNTVYAVDYATNQSAMLSVVVEYISGTPSISVTSPVSGRLTNRTSITVSGTAGVDDGIVDRVEVSLNGGTFLSASGTLNWSKSMSLNEGTNTIIARVISSAGKTNTASGVTVYADTTRPEVSIQSPADGSEFTNGVMTVSGTASDGFSGIKAVYLAANDDGFIPVGGTASWSQSIALTIGTHTLKAFAVDNAGNSSLTDQTIITVSEPETNPEPLKVYCKQPTGWAGVRIHFWGGTCGSTAWPGLAMSNTGGGWYVYAFTNGSNTSLLFNNAGGGSDPQGANKTADLSRTGTGWYWTNGQWYDSNPEQISAELFTEPGAGSFYFDSYAVTLRVDVDGLITAKYTTNGADPSTGATFTDGMVIDIAAGMNVGESRTLKMYALGSEGSIDVNYTFTKILRPRPANGTLEVIPNVKPTNDYYNLWARNIHVYLPPGYDLYPDESYKVLYMQDGQNLWDKPGNPYGGWKVDTTASSLINAGTIEPIIVVGIENAAGVSGDYYQRAGEYVGFSYGYGTMGPDYRDLGNDYTNMTLAYEQFLIEQVMPMINARYRTKTGRENTAIAGSSFGAGVSVFLGFRNPDQFFGLGALFFGDYSGTTDTIKEKPFWVEDYLGAKTVGSGTGLKVYLDCGDQDVDAVFMYRAMDLNTTLTGLDFVSGSNYFYRIVNGTGHNEGAWAARFDDVLEFLFGM